jgi:DNA-binding CsgD family transcriptional regulator
VTLEQLNEALQVAERLRATRLVADVVSLPQTADLKLRWTEVARRTSSQMTMTWPLGFPLRARGILALVTVNGTIRKSRKILFLRPEQLSAHVSNIQASVGVTSRMETAAIAFRAERRHC